jgi:hypothetical protein
MKNVLDTFFGILMSYQLLHNIIHEYEPMNIESVDLFKILKDKQPLLQ